MLLTLILEEGEEAKGKRCIFQSSSRDISLSACVQIIASHHRHLSVSAHHHHTRGHGGTQGRKQRWVRRRGRRRRQQQLWWVQRVWCRSGSSRTRQCSKWQRHDVRHCHGDDRDQQGCDVAAVHRHLWHFLVISGVSIHEVGRPVHVTDIAQPIHFV